MRIGVLIIGILVLAIGTTSLVTGVTGSPLSEQFVQSFTLAPGQELLVQGVNGRITYEPWDGDEVKIEATRQKKNPLSGWAERLWGEVTVEFSQNERGVQAVTRRPGTQSFLNRVNVRFHVRVPRDWWGDVTLSTSNGPITATAIHGDVTLRTSNGTITVEDHTGALEARTSNGTIRLTNVNGKVQVRTSNGVIRFLGGTLSGTGLLRTSNGPVELRARLAADASYDVTTSNGGVTLVLTEPDVDLDLSTSNGRIDLRTDVTVSSLERRRVIGRIGEGTAALNVKTSNGSITLSAASDQN